MGRPEKALYASAQRLLRRFEAEQIPFIGPIGSDLVAWNLNPATSLTAWFHRDSTAPGSASLEEGLQLLSRLESQLAVLKECEEDTRDALGDWADLAQKYQIPPSSHLSFAGVPAYMAAAACEAGMELLTEHVLNLTDPLGIYGSLDEEQEDEDERGLGVEELAQTVLQRAAATGIDLTNKSDISGRLHALVDVLYRTPKIKLKYEPFEWVYEGLNPLLLPKVLRKRKGTPAALAVAAAAVGRRVNVSLLPMPAASIEAGAGQDPDAAIPVENLPPDLQQRVSSSTQAAAPGPGQWLLKVFADTSTSRSPEDTLNRSNEEYNSVKGNNNNNNGVEIEDLGLYVDPSNGHILSSLEIQTKFPAVGHLSPAEWQEQSVLRTWQGLCRIAMQAHQRRGESDFVAHWMFICLALDPSAPEWNRALAAPEVK
ncbi:hypothetical protein Ndes2526B_g03781 [Nannochloris sp. 'desiccata']|nr:hypothetical protein KSW81_005359 [Chlorella desiccata (nom. nud.)]KAH7621432.1 hypothetical protein NADE_006695 [Chlorella desiccata (nom. nud.)]